MGFNPLTVRASAHHVNVEQLEQMRHIRARHDVLGNKNGRPICLERLPCGVYEIAVRSKGGDRR